VGDASPRRISTVLWNGCVIFRDCFSWVMMPIFFLFGSPSRFHSQGSYKMDDSNDLRRLPRTLGLRTDVQDTRQNFLFDHSHVFVFSAL